MTIVFAILAAACFAILIFVLLQNRKLELAAAAANQEAERQRKHYEAETARVYSETQAAVAEAQKLIDQQTAELKQESERVHNEAQQEADRQRQHYEGETARVYSEAQAAVAEAQKLIDQQIAGLKQESEHVRQHYGAEARKVQEAADGLVAKNMAEVDSLRKFELLRDAEAETQRQLSEAIKEATALREQADALLAKAREAAADERFAANEKAKDIHEQADARLNQAIRDAGRIMAAAEKRAEQIGGDAYTALREKQTLEQAAEAMRNIIEGYGDRYLVPAHSVLDDLADKFGYDAAGQALKSARALSKRMVEQGEAATCDYAEANRRRTAVQFVIHAFNGDVDSHLSEVMDDNSGTLAQKIRDAFNTVNKDGSAFRNARILPAYLDARLAELDCAVRMREFVQRMRDDQRAEREKMRDEALAKKEQAEKLRAAEKLEELKQLAAEETKRELEEAKQQLAEAAAEDMVKWEKRVSELEERYQGTCEDVAVATEQKLQISQITREGSIYIISNEGSFGPGVYKIGFTRREPEMRVDELGDASVPFEFDILAVIKTEDAPELEYKLHKHFIAKRMNKRNRYKKEFFRVSLAEIREEVGKLTKDAQWRETEAGRASEWQESREIENDPQARDKWLKGEQEAADERWRQRERRLANRRALGVLTPSNSDGLDTDADEQGTSQPLT